MIKLLRENGKTLMYAQRWCQRSKTFFLNELHIKGYSTIEGKESHKKAFLLKPKLKKEGNNKEGNNKEGNKKEGNKKEENKKEGNKKEGNKKENLKIDSEVQDNEDLYFSNNLIEKKIADIKIKESHNKMLFKYLPIEGRTSTVPLLFKIMKYLYLSILSGGVVLIHAFYEIDKEQYIRDIWTFEVYFLSCFLSFNGGFNSMFQLIQYAIPFWLFREMKFLILLTIVNQFLLLISEAQMYRGRRVSLKLD